MSIYQVRLAAAAEKRLSVLVHDAANLNLSIQRVEQIARPGQACGTIGPEIATHRQ
jgi:hypothetical protein